MIYSSSLEYECIAEYATIPSMEKVNPIEIAEYASQTEQFGNTTLEVIPDEDVRERLELTSPLLPDSLLTSVAQSSWYTTDNGRIMLEVRNKEKLKQPIKGILYLSDLDDTLIATTDWHKTEYHLLSKHQALMKRNVTISPDRAKHLYDRSKMNIPGIREARYTPKVNIILASLFAKALERGEPPDASWEKTIEACLEIQGRLITEGETHLDAYDQDEDIVKCLVDNPTSEFVFDDIAEDLLNGTDEADMRVLGTRGKIEGILGQVYKMHTTDLLNRGQKVDMVIYTNDLKAVAFPLLYDMVPKARENGMRIYDDNPSEIDNYLDWAKENGVTNLEVIGVRHPTAKRKNTLVSHEPIMRTGEEPNTTYDLYFSSHDVFLRDVI